MKALTAALVCAAALLAPVAPAAAAPPTATAETQAVVPVWAYYYIWFNASSWNRAKRDYPLAGRYSSDEQSVMVRQIREAKAAGITGFLVSWKDTPLNDSRLDLLVEAADSEHFDLGLVYQGLDVRREPIPAARVQADLVRFAGRWGTRPAFARTGGPLVIWAGTWRFSIPDLTAVRRATAGRLTLLASERHTDRWGQVGALLDGNAYYWSSLDPAKDTHAAARLQQMGEAVHGTHDLWIAPVAPGFDARLIGGTRAVERAGGQTLRTEWQLAVGSSPDALGVISWNEYTENTFVEPSRLTGHTALQTLAALTHAKGPQGELDSSAPGATGGGNPWRFELVLGLLLALALVAVLRAVRPVARPLTSPPTGGGLP